MLVASRSAYQQVTIDESADPDTGRTHYRAAIGSLGDRRVVVYDGTDRLGLERLLRRLRKAGFEVASA